jgi:tetratricopeptide (TPR) repeat protein
VEVGSAEYAEELRAAKQAIRLGPHFALAHNLLASLYLREEKSALAIEQCEAALQIDPTNQEALYHLILAARNTNRKEEVPALTKKLADLRAAANEREAHTPRYKLVEVRGTDHPSNGTPN